MDEERQNRRADDVEVNAPFGWKVRFPAKSLSAVVVVVAATSLIAYMIRDHDIRQQEQLSRLAAERQAQLKIVTEQQDAIKGSMDTVAYVLLLDPQQRSRLKLDMPEAMRRKLLDQERPR